MEGPTLEQEIADIERRLAEKKAALKQVRGDKEVLHEVVGEKIQEVAPGVAPTLPTSGAVGTPTDSIGAAPVAEPPSYLSDDLKNQVQELVNLAFSKGLTEAIKTVNKINNPALLDAFHDVLVDQLYDTLIERGKLEKV